MQSNLIHRCFTLHLKSSATTPELTRGRSRIWRAMVSRCQLRCSCLRCRHRSSLHYSRYNQLKKNPSTILLYLQTKRSTILKTNRHLNYSEFIKEAGSRTGSQDRPGKFSLTGLHYWAQTLKIYHDILIVQQSLWAPTVCTENSKVWPIAKDIRVNQFENIFSRIDYAINLNNLT